MKFVRVYWALGWAYVGVIVFLTLTSSPPAGPDVPYADKWEHFLAYGLLMAWFGQLVPAGPQRWRWALSFAAMGGLLELLQGLGGIRHAEWADFVANSIGVLLGHLASRGAGGRLLSKLEIKHL